MVKTNKPFVFTTSFDNALNYTIMHLFPKTGAESCRKKQPRILKYII